MMNMPANIDQTVQSLGHPKQGADLMQHKHFGLKSTQQFKYAGPLINAATGVLALIQQITQSERVDDPIHFRRTVVNTIQQFEHDAKLHGVPAMSVLTARYVLCATLDEMILNMPWGQAIGWHVETMLALFHEDTWGGEKFFSILQDLQKDPSMHCELLELMYLCLSLGFQGKYRLEARGMESLEHLRQHLMFVLGRFKSTQDPQAEPKPKKVPTKIKPYRFWRITLISFAGLLLLSWVGLVVMSDMSLSHSIDLVHAASRGLS